jgi:hypothetical protein
MIVQTLDPGAQGENNLYNIDWAGSPYANAAEAGAVQVTNILRPPKIDDVERSFNQSFTNTKFLMGLPKIQCEDVKDVWREYPFMSSPVIARDTAAVVNNPGAGTVEQTIPVTDATWLTVGIKHKLVYPQAAGAPITHATVIAKAGAVGARTITVRSYNGMSLPAVVAGQKFGNSGPRQGDGEPMPANTFRDTVVQFWNGMEQLGGFGNRWDPLDSARWDSLGGNAYKVNELKRTQELFYGAIAQTILIGNGGEQMLTTLQDGRKSFATKGIIPQLERAGVGVTPTTSAGFQNLMREAVHDLQVEDDQNKWLLIAPSRVLDSIGLSEKAERVRYQYNDKTFDSRITSYEYWGHSVIPLRMNIMQSPMFGDSFKNRAILIRESQLKLTQFRNWPMFAKYLKLANNQNSNPVTGYANIEAGWWSALFGVRVEKAWSGAMFDVLN